LKRLKPNINTHIGCLGTFSEKYAPDASIAAKEFVKALEKKKK
jgi:hypothetical protein